MENKENMKKVAYYLSIPQINRLKKLSRKLSLSMAAIIRIAVNEYIEKNKDK